ncbi:thymidylate kinase [Lentinus tigrinus ALCF2SS1-7]|uniref:Thymidylate kinase n=1 Tax=Lentinus tigrinus ALCF2SS1-6 TaxID=1328759 RepID=A0A5C2SL67_9APHY|nr:thymidylate kinase [Lentinus tigrinus ALCF2SS1-6]RPD76240.1 thymidylate kinase [Lentinus tigrinus ALCF2SS1-7]
MPERKTRGSFIVVEGLDRSGKSTQVSLLDERLKAAGVSVRLIKFPDRTTPIGKLIDSYLQSQSEMDDRSIHLLFSANRWELAKSIEESLEAGTIVICDRYAFSGIAFSAAKNAPGMSYEWCRGPDVYLPAPDLTLFLAVSPEQQQARGGFGAERYEKSEFQERVEHVFERIGVEMGDGSRWIAVDADAKKEEVAEEMWRLVQPLAKGTDKPLARLWADLDERVRNSNLYI